MHCVIRLAMMVVLGTKVIEVVLGEIASFFLWRGIVRVGEEVCWSCLADMEW